MTRRIRITLIAVTLSAATIGGLAAFAGGGAEDQEVSPSLGVPAPGFDDVDETRVTDGSGLDLGMPVPGFEGEVDETTVTDGPIREGDRGSSYRDEEAVRSGEGAVTNGDLADEEDELVVGDGPLTMKVPAPGFAGLVDEMVVGTSELDSLVDDVETC